MGECSQVGVERAAAVPSDHRRTDASPLLVLVFKLKLLKWLLLRLTFNKINI